MPKYKNYTSGTIILPNGECNPVSAGGTATLKGYVRSTNGLTLIDHDEQRIRPFTRLLAAAPNTNPTITGLEAYDTMIIKNFSGGAITVTPNGDTANPMTMADDEIMTFAIKTPSGRIEWSTLRITGTGTANVYVYGFKED